MVARWAATSKSKAWGIFQGILFTQKVRHHSDDSLSCIQPMLLLASESSILGMHVNDTGCRLHTFPTMVMFIVRLLFDVAPVAQPQSHHWPPAAWDSVIKVTSIGKRVEEHAFMSSLWLHGSANTLRFAALHSISVRPCTASQA